MKTYHFRELIVAWGFVTIYLSVIIYGSIWLQREYTVGERISRMNLKIENMQLRQNKMIHDLENRIMPSALKGITVRSKK